MSLSSLVFRLIHELLLGDRPILGRPWLGLFRCIVLVELPALMIFVDLRWGLFGPFSAFVHRLALVYFLGLSSAFVAGVAYLKDIYDLDSHRMPFWHLISSFLGLGVPRIDVSNRLKDASGKEMVETIGGPAYLNIGTGYAVLTEKLTAPANIFTTGKKFISRHERVQEFVDLHEQEDGIDTVTAITRDGISVTVENIRFLFRLWDRQWETETTRPTTAMNPYPFSKDAIFDYVYPRTVSVDELGRQKPFSWRGAVRGRLGAIIKNYISDHKLDDVIASREHREEEHPRVVIRKKAYDPDFKKGMRSMGTVLRWWDPGEFKSMKNIEDQFLSNWNVDIDSHIQSNHAHGEAQKEAYEELGRAEAEAELLMSIINSLEGIKLASDKPHTLQNLILMRTAQVIRALSTPARDTHSKDSDDPAKKKQTER
jgi:hypothetical protein